LAKPQTGLSTTARVVLSSAASFGLLAAVLFGCAGRLDWVLGWLYLALATANIAVTYFYLYRCNPELIRYRMQVGKGTKTWDKVWAVAFAPVFLAVYAVAALDAGRYAWSAVPLWLWPVGAALFLAGNALLSWSMGVNPFFEKTVRIQSERGHRVIDTGPYRLVRHPGYLGFAGWIVSAPLLLGSWWAFAPAALSLAGLVVRTALEDRTLRRELTGYVDYAGRVRFRLIPGVW
jgi:protein-S-isoprenylcysteine O-methyltransferase Ste14